MSETNITLRDLFSVSGEEIAGAPPLGIRVHAETTAVKEQLDSLAKGVSWGAVKDTVGDSVVQLLDVPVLDIVLGGWKKMAKVMEYADLRKYPKGKTNLVPLSEHTIKSQHHPYLEVSVKGRQVGKLVFDIELSLTLEGLVMRIQDAAIKAIQSGVLKGNGIISMKGVPLVKKTFARISLPGSVQLGTGILLKS